MRFNPEDLDGVSIAELRQLIDETDVKLVTLIHERMSLAAAMTQHKHDAGMPVACPDREDAVIGNVVARGQTLDDKHGTQYMARVTLSVIWQALFNQAKVIQHTLLAEDN